MTLPNAITLARLLAVPAAVWLIVRGWHEAALWVFLLAGLSDAVDGWLARRLGQVSRLGSLLDPVADKALLVSVFLSLGARGLLPAWLVILVVFRDALIVCGWLLGQILMPSAQPVRPHWTSKLNTCAQLAFAAGVLAMLAWRFDMPLVEVGAYAVVTVTTAVSGGVYVITWMRGMMRLERGGSTA